MITLAGCLIALIAFPFVTIPSIIYGIAGYILLPVGFFFNLFVSRPSGIRAALIANRLIPVFLLIGIPFILYFYVEEIAGWAFFAWMIIYFLSRIYSGVHKREARMIQAWKELAIYEAQKAPTYIKNHPVLIAIIVVLNILLILIGYFTGGSDGLRIGIILAIIIWWLTPYGRETIVRVRSLDNKDENRN